MKKTYLIILTILILHLAKCDELDPSYNYDKFMAHYGRTYTGQQKLQHERIFNINYLDLLKRKLHGDDVIINQFLDWNQTQTQNFFNYKPLQNSKLPKSSIPLSSSFVFASPTAFDWRSLGRVTPIKDQKSCGCCWAFASTAAYQSALAIQTNGTMYDLAQQYAFQCQVNSNGCNGGYDIYALSLLNKTGVPLQSKYPYNYNTLYNQSILCNQNNVVKLSSKVPVINQFANLSTQQIQQSIATYGPLVGLVYADKAFQSTGPSGLINNCTNGSINHAILVVGYNTTHWFIKNSWNTGWGDKGFGYILKTNPCQLGTYVDIMQTNFSSAPAPIPIPTPNPPSGYITLYINMTDSSSNGWNGTTLGLSQNGVVVAAFGANFTSGAKFGPILATITNTSQTTIVVVKLGTATNQIGFTIYFSNGTILFTRTAGTTFTASTILGTFCPSSKCIVPISITYYLTLSSSCGNGWGGNTLSFRQNNSIIATIGSNFTNGSVFSNFNLTLNSTLQVDIIVGNISNGTQRVGLIIRTAAGNIIFQRDPGASYYSNSLLGSWVPSTAVAYVPSIFLQQPSQNMEISVQSTVSQSTFNKVLIATIVLGSSVFILIVVVIFLVIKILRITQRNSIKFNNVLTEGNNHQNLKQSETSSMPGSATLLKIS